MSQLDDFMKNIEQYQRAQRAHIVDTCAEFGRTLECVETSLEYKKDHRECEMCGEASDIEAHNIIPHSRLTEGQRHE
jgi:hypothetical protein